MKKMAKGKGQKTKAEPKRRVRVKTGTLNGSRYLFIRFLDANKPLPGGLRVARGGA